MKIFYNSDRIFLIQLFYFDLFGIFCMPAENIIWKIFSTNRKFIGFENSDHFS